MVPEIKFQPGMYADIKAGALLVTDGRLLDQLHDATVRAVQHGSHKRTGVLVLVYKDTLELSELGGDKPLPPVPVGGYVSRPEALDGQGRHLEKAGRLHPHSLHTRGRPQTASSVSTGAARR